MVIGPGIEVDAERLAEICRRYGVVELSVFGSVARGEAGPDSDVDLLYELAPGTFVGWNVVRLQQDLEHLLRRPVDVVSKQDVHWFIRDRVLAEARSVYAA